ncbi:MAG: ABC transporter permease, partial [Planctomycetaceae bacterium]
MLRSCRWLKAVWRTEFRNVVFNPSRHVLVCLLIAIPIAALVAGANFLFVTDPTNAERATSEMGRADLRADVGGLLTVTELRQQLPAGSQVEIVSRNIDEVRVPGRSMDVQSWRMDLAGLANGMLDIVRGSAPQSDAEVAVSERLLASLDLQVGDLITIRDSQAKIVGVVENPEDLDAPVLLRAALNAGFVEMALVALPAGAAASPVQIDSVRVTTRDDVALGFADIDGFMLIAIFGFAEAALVIAAAFVVGLRRRQREIGLLASCGGSPFQVLTSVVASAFLISLAAAVIGTIVGVLAVRVGYPWFDEFKGRRCGDFEVCWGRHAFAVTLGVLTGVIAVTLPAIAAARLPIRTALSGRRPPPRGSGRFMLVGFILVATGVALVWYAPSLMRRDGSRSGDNSAIQAILAGSILGVLGFGLWSPWLLGRF